MVDSEDHPLSISLVTQKKGHNFKLSVRYVLILSAGDELIPVGISLAQASVGSVLPTGVSQADVALILVCIEESHTRVVQPGVRRASLPVDGFYPGAVAFLANRLVSTRRSFFFWSFTRLVPTIPPFLPRRLQPGRSDEVFVDSFFTVVDGGVCGVAAAVGLIVGQPQSSLEAARPTKRRTTGLVSGAKSTLTLSSPPHRTHRTSSALRE